MTSVKNTNLLPPGLVSNLQEVLLSRKGGGGNDGKDNSNNPNEDNSNNPTEPSTSSNEETNVEEVEDNSKPIILVTNGDGIESPGLVYLVEALVREGLYNVNVCAPQSNKSASGHSVTLGETVAATSTEMNGATAYEVSGTPADCISLAMSGALFSWSKPLLVISGINQGATCGHNMFYSGAVAGAREALANGVPSFSISLNWNKDESQESDFKDAVAVCLPLINAAIRDIENGSFPKSCSLNVEIPTSPSTNKGFKLTRQSMWRSSLNWLAVSSRRYPAGHFMSNQQSLGMQLAQLGRDASAAGAARRLTTQRKNLEVVESIGVAGKSDANRVKKYFRLEFLDKEQEETDDDLDFRALESGFVAITPLSLSPCVESHIQEAASDWISSALS